MSAPGRRSFVCVSAKGAAFNVEPGATPQVSWRAEIPALKARFSLRPSAKAEMKRAFSARIRADKFPGAMPQALNNAAPLALNANDSSSAYVGVLRQGRCLILAWGIAQELRLPTEQALKARHSYQSLGHRPRVMKFEKTLALKARIHFRHTSWISAN